MFLEGHTVSLRALEPADADLLYTWENNRDLWAVSFTVVPFSKFILEEFVQSAYNDIYTNRQLRLIVLENNNKEPIGSIDLFEFDPQHARCGVGIYIHENHRLNGCGTECIELIKDYCFNTLLLKQIFAHVNALNLPSLALFEKTGFERSGLKRAWNRSGLNTFEDVWFLQCFNNGD